ncbi:spaetzle-processing enzyme-like [Drosophila eugracilis]|uniref:spaetzle-processing enzyme-like n=1 Tax=Drosophila eugracilis TaxID=29029 RepID=UPI0007E6F0BA|nr:spaetzle-processing enzyme-like [Drosophila eugracilis]
MNAFVVIALLLLFRGSFEVSGALLDDNCGTTKPHLRDKRMVGGEDAGILSNPWMVLLVGESIAGGSLINSRYVMTAAHCLAIPFKKNDIALIRMARVVAFSDYIRPICLLVNQQLEQQISVFKVTGWGKTNNNPNSSILQSATVDRLDVQKCREIFESPNDNTQICAGSWDSDPCIGDSGGPLSAKLTYGNTVRIFQFGIVSYGTLTCDGPSFYTDVMAYMNWIVNSSPCCKATTVIVTSNPT